MKSTSPEYQALILDFGAVISRTPFEMQPTIEAALGLDAGTLTWRGPLDPDSDELWRRMQRDELSEREYWRLRAAEMGRLVGCDWTVQDYYIEICNRIGPSWFRDGVEMLVADARMAGLKTAVLTNELELFHGGSFMESVPALKLIDAVVDATHTGILKPDSRAYELASQALGIPMHACLFVDDQPRNVTGGNAAGMPSLWFDIREPDRAVEFIRKELGLA